MSLFDRVFKGPSASPGGPASSEAAVRYDEVAAPGPDGQAERMSKQQFESLPLENRVRLLVQGTLRFYRNGNEVPPSEAMRTAF